MKLSHLLTILGVNAVPALGWLLGDWSSGTTLVVYWFETVAATLFLAARTLVHRRVVPVRGHFRYAPTESAKQNGANIPFLKHFLPVTLIFSAGHAIFLAAIFLLLSHNGRGAEVRLNGQEILTGCGLILAFQTAEFLIDLIRLKGRPFRWIESLAERNMSRALVVHMTLIIGMLVGGLTDGARGFFLVFVILKTMNDLSWLLPQYDPEEPPRWLCCLMDKVPNIGKGKDASFAKFWTDGKVAERARRAKNEQPFSP